MYNKKAFLGVFVERKKALFKEERKKKAVKDK